MLTLFDQMELDSRELVNAYVDKTSNQGGDDTDKKTDDPSCKLHFQDVLQEAICKGIPSGFYQKMNGRVPVLRPSPVVCIHT